MYGAEVEAVAEIAEAIGLVFVCEDIGNRDPTGRDLNSVDGMGNVFVIVDGIGSDGVNTGVHDVFSFSSLSLNSVERSSETVKST